MGDDMPFNQLVTGSNPVRPTNFPDLPAGWHTNPDVM